MRFLVYGSILFVVGMYMRCENKSNSITSEVKTVIDRKAANAWVDREGWFDSDKKRRRGNSAGAAIPDW